jgi:hypothetical protein
MTKPRIIFNRLLNGWFIVRGPHQTPIGGRFESRAAAAAHLKGEQEWEAHQADRDARYEESVAAAYVARGQGNLY